MCDHQKEWVASRRCLTLLFVFLVTMTMVTTPFFASASASADKANGNGEYRYAEYKVSAEQGIQFFGHMIRPEEMRSTQGVLLWTSVHPLNSQVELVNVTLSIENLTVTLRFNCTNGKLSFNESYYGANVFEVLGLKAGQTVDLGSSTRKETGIVEGPFDAETPYGTYSGWLIDISVPLMNQSIVSGYGYHVETGLLLSINLPGGWLFNLFGIESIFGEMRLSSTNIDLGSPNIGALIGELYPIATMFVAIMGIALLYRHKNKRTRRFRRQR